MLMDEKYPSALHRYMVYFDDNSSQIFHGCGATNAVYVAEYTNPSKKVIDIEMLDDQWKVAIF